MAVYNVLHLQKSHLVIRQIPTWLFDLYMYLPGFCFYYATFYYVSISLNV